MAKKKSSKKRSPRRRRVGAAALNASSPLVLVAGAAAGYFLGGKINDMISEKAGNIDGKIIGAAEAGLGAFLIMQKGKKTMIKSLGGAFLAGMGAKKLLTELGVINGIGGYQNVPVIGGYQNVPVIGKRKMAGYIPGSGHLGGYKVPRPIHQTVMGNAAGSGSGLMESAR